MEQDAERRRAPLVCTASPRNMHVDYGVPIVFNKSCDYRTSTGKSHEFIPSVPQQFTSNIGGASVRTTNPELFNVDIGIRDENITSSYNDHYKFNPKTSSELEKTITAPHNASYIRNVEEQIKMNPSPCLCGLKLSEMKDKFRMNYYQPEHRIMEAPCTLCRCEIQALGRDEQPPVRPEQQNFWKYLDIYLTENRANFLPYNSEQLRKAREDFLTIYSACGKWKGSNDLMPRKHGNSRVFDKSTLKAEYPWKKLSDACKRVPNFGMVSTSRETYTDPTKSMMAPYLNGKNNEVPFEIPNYEPSPWQTNSPPWMYCSEYCHVGTGLPVRAVVDIAAEPPPRAHPPCKENNR